MSSMASQATPARLTLPLLALQLPGADDAQGLLALPGMTPELQTNLIFTVIVVLVLLFARRGLLTFVSRRVESQSLRYRWSKATGYAAFVIGGLILVQVWFTAIRSLGTFLGLLSAGLAIALKDLVADFAGWVFILWRRPFDLGDRIQIGEHAGDVVDRRIFQFTIMEIGNWVEADQSTGRLIHIPNATLFTKPLANYVAGFPYLWNELQVTVTFESDWRKAKQLLETVAEDFTIDIKQDSAGRRRDEERFLIHYRKLTPVVYVSVVDHGVMLTLRYLCRPRERRGSGADLWERILDTFAEAPDVVLAYPTQRINLAREVTAETGGTVGAESVPEEPPS